MVLVAHSETVDPFLRVAECMEDPPRTTLMDRQTHTVGEFAFPLSYDLLPQVCALLRAVSETRGAHTILQTIKLRRDYDGVPRESYTPVRALALQFIKDSLFD